MISELNKNWKLTNKYAPKCTLLFSTLLLFFPKCHGAVALGSTKEEIILAGHYLRAMGWFVKTEVFTARTQKLPFAERRPYLDAHRKWVDGLQSSGRRVRSGYLVDGEGRPGGGGVLLFEATSYPEAEELVKDDPMIKNELVTWDLHEWLPVSGDGKDKLFD